MKPERKGTKELPCRSVSTSSHKGRGQLEEVFSSPLQLLHRVEYDCWLGEVRARIFFWSLWLNLCPFLPCQLFFCLKEKGVGSLVTEARWLTATHGRDNRDPQQQAELLRQQLQIPEQTQTAALETSPFQAEMQAGFVCES